MVYRSFKHIDAVLIKLIPILLNCLYEPSLSSLQVSFIRFLGALVTLFVFNLHRVKVLTNAFDFVTNSSAHPYSAFHKLSFFVHFVNLQLVQLLIFSLKPLNLTFQFFPL